MRQVGLWWHDARVRIHLFAIAALATACGHATLVQRTPTTAIYELGGNRHFAMEDVRGQAAEHCSPRGFVITQEGEEPVGFGPSIWPRGSVSVSTEWRVHIECR